MDSKPTEITVKQFVDEHYATKILLGKCIVKIFDYDRVMTYKQWIAVESIALPAPGDEYFIISEGREWTDYGDRSMRVTWLEPTAQATDTAPTAAAGESGAVMDFEDRYEKLVYQWSDTHLAVSAALGIEFNPEGDDKRYTDAITGLREQVTRLLDKVEEQQAELAASRQREAELTAELKASEDEYKRLIHEMNHWGYES